MHHSLQQIQKELSSFGLNPAQWLIQKISLQKESAFVLFESAQDKNLQLKGLLKRNSRQSFQLGSLEVFSL